MGLAHEKKSYLQEKNNLFEIGSQTFNCRLESEKEMIMKPIAEESVLFRSPNPAGIYCYTPSLCHAFNGRIAASFDLSGPAITELEGPHSDSGDAAGGNQLQIHLSDDHGRSWRRTAVLPMLHATIFRAGKALYVIGHSGRLLISRSDDNGEHWSSPAILESEHQWHQSAGRIDHRHGKVYVAYEQRLGNRNWPDVAPVLLAACEDADLTDPANWTFSEPLDINRQIRFPNDLGVPFFPNADLVPGRRNDPRWCGAPGILETSVVRIYDSDHLFYDPADRTVLLFMRAHTGSSNLAAVLKGVENEDGSLKLDYITTPGGARFFYIPFPGGQMKFHLDYDPVSKLYWLVSSQATDSFTRPERLSDERFNLPNNERNRLQLSFSRNGFDWCFAGMIAIGHRDKASRHYASLLIDGDDLLVLSRSGDDEAASPHNGNLITLHRVADFRSLVY